MILNKAKVIDIVRSKYDEQISEAGDKVPTSLGSVEYEDQKFDMLLNLTTEMQHLFQANVMPSGELLDKFQDTLREDFEKYRRRHDRALQRVVDLTEKRDLVIETVSAYAEVNGNISLTMAEAKTLGIL